MLPLNGYDDALLRLVVSFIGYHQSLAGLDATRRRNQSAVSIDGDREGLLVEGISILGIAIDEYRDLDVDPSRLAAIRTPQNRCTDGLGVLTLAA